MVVYIVVTEGRVETVGSVFMVCFFKLKNFVLVLKDVRN